MINTEQKTNLEKLGKSLFADKLKAYLVEELEYANDVSAIRSWEETLEKKGKAQFIKEFLSLLDEKKVEKKNQNQYN